MRISHKHKFVFYSKPRCGSNTFRKKLNQYSDVIIEGGSHNSGLRPHSRCYVVNDWFKENNLFWNDYFHFINIRNPWDMLVSLYHFGLPTKDGEYHWSIRGESRHQLLQSGNVFSFKQWIVEGKSPHEKYFNYKKGTTKYDYTSNDISYWSLNRYVCNRYGRILIDEVVRLEHIQDDFKNKIQPKLNLPNFNYNFYHLNKGNYKDRENKPYQEYYDKESKERVEDLYSLDIKLGNYTFN